MSFDTIMRGLILVWPYGFGYSKSRYKVYVLNERRNLNE